MVAVFSESADSDVTQFEELFLDLFLQGLVSVTHLHFLMVFTLGFWFSSQLDVSSCKSKNTHLLTALKNVNDIVLPNSLKIYIFKP